MPDTNARRTFRGLPLTAAQDAEIRHYIKAKTRRHEPWDTPELEAMLKDMLTPPIGAQEESVEFLDQAKASAERAASSVDEAMEPTEAYEERNAAKEAEAMKRPRE
ncbi:MULTISPECIES: hypothetical protein [Ralstonia solanacearum species complex]|uniref:hypothetical protein n=1 Tax=Ralstonia solanacearum species complex TaxID=3116862 RepID=UPI000576BD71|nr:MULTISPECIES: hypothetical protein [Ralstonia solanacearum species complex]ARS54935.1 hypothetical protein BC427_01685 [Ralstonia solanacearum FJAT-91]AMP38722.1 hypothetical protein LBM2029_14780 [Ralstonia solanacearum]AOE88461.1 hypothetical protein LBM341_00143 [Ralstonia solanacearum]AXV70575.1 hypothetical protein CJO74_15535 [Ralstonia solanacearum]AXV87547.1 hypothetical protein CJO78_15195 [Ralstonia solanacearum]